METLQSLMGSYEGLARRDVPACHDGRETVWPDSQGPLGRCLSIRYVRYWDDQCLIRHAISGHESAFVGCPAAYTEPTTCAVTTSGCRVA